MESTRASKVNWKHHSGNKAPHRVQLSKCDNSRGDPAAHEHRRGNQDHLIRSGRRQYGQQYNPWRPCLHEMKVVPSTYHQLLKFPTPEGIKQIREINQRQVNWMQRRFSAVKGKNLTNSNYRNQRAFSLDQWRWRRGVIGIPPDAEILSSTEGDICNQVHNRRTRTSGFVRRILVKEVSLGNRTQSRAQVRIY